MPNGLAMMPWYPGDFAAATRGWPLLARAAYRELLDAQWSLSDPLPADPARLAAIVGISPDEWQLVVDFVLPKFPRTHGGRANLRLEEHRAKALKRREEHKHGAEVTNAKRYAERTAERHAARSLSVYHAGDSPPTPTPTLELNPKTKSAPRRAPRAVIRADQEPDAAWISNALTQVPDMDPVATWAEFRNHHLSRGTLIADVHATWATWVSNIKHKGFAYVRRTAASNAPPPGPRFSTIAELRAWDARQRAEANVAGSSEPVQLGLAGEATRPDDRDRSQEPSEGHGMDRQPAAPF